MHIILKNAQILLGALIPPLEHASRQSRKKLIRSDIVEPAYALGTRTARASPGLPIGTVLASAGAVSGDF